MILTDTALKETVIEELRWTPGVNETRIGVSVNDGAVTLSGEVGSYPEKLLAADATMGVRGVTAIAQEINVAGDWGIVNDTDVAREAGYALERAIDVPESVKAQVHGHVVELSGMVEWQYQRSAAHRTVQYLRGVSGVVDTITVKPRARAVDVKSAINAALVRSAQLEAKHITVATDPEGIVHLDGTVRSLAERRQAENAAWSSDGVNGVRNELKIKY